MYRIIPVAALALGMAVSVAAQDSTVTSKTKVSGDDARALALTGCLERGPAGVFTLNNATARSGDEVTTKSKVETDVDNHGKDVKTKSQAEVEHEDGRHAGIAGLKASTNCRRARASNWPHTSASRYWSPQSRSTPRRVTTMPR